MPAKIKLSNIYDLGRRYEAGESLNKLAREVGISRFTITQRFRDIGIGIRTISDTMFARWANATPKQREAMLSRAHSVAKGRKVTDQERIQQAITREKTLSGATPAEYLLAGWLCESGVGITQQRAVWIYNLDIAIHEPPFAVEICGGGWHSHGRHLSRFHERIKYLLDGNWKVVIVWVDGLRHPLTRQCADHIVALTKLTGGNPAFGGVPYWVILGDGNTASICKTYLNTPADIERLSSG